MNDQIRSPQEFDVALVTGVMKYRSGRIPKGLMIRDVRHGGTVTGNSIRNRRSRVVQVLRFDQDFTDPEETFFQFRVMKAAGEILELDGKIRILHLTRQRFFQTALKCSRTVDVQFRSGKECRSEEWKSLDVIPVRVADQEMYPVRTGSGQHIQTEQPNTCSAIEHERSAALRTHFHARSIAAKECSFWTWCGD